MTIEGFLQHVAERKPLSGDRIGHFMNRMSKQARRVTFRLNGAYHTPDEVRQLLYVVTQDVEAGAIVGGVPHKKIGTADNKYCIDIETQKVCRNGRPFALSLMRQVIS